MASERTLVWMKHRFLGDAVLATALLNALQAHGVKGEAWASMVLVDLLEGIAPNLPRIPIGKGAGMTEFFRLVQRARKGKYQTAILVNRNWRSAVVTKLAGIPVRVGHATEKRDRLLTLAVPYDDKRSEKESYLDLARALAIPTEDAKIQLVVTEQEKAQGLELLHGATVGVQPGSTNPFKAISADTVRAVVEAAHRKGRRVAFFGGAEEKPFLEGLQADVDLVGGCRLRQTIGAIANLETFVAGDTGLVHIAAALGVPTVAAYLDQFPISKWGHAYAPHFNIQTSEGLDKLDPQILVKEMEARLGPS